MGKNKQTGFRFTEETLAELKELAEHEKRSMANELEVLIHQEHEKLMQDAEANNG